MFSDMELRLIRYAVNQTMEQLKDKRNTVDPESDDAVEITNDLMLYQISMEKINEKKEV